MTSTNTNSMNPMENQTVDFLRVDPTLPGQQVALISMVEPKNSKLLMNKESFIATRFLKSFIEEYKQVLEYKCKEGEDKLTDEMNAKLDISYENIKDKYYSFQSLTSAKLEEEFESKYNTNNEPTITGLKIRGTFPNKMVAAQKAKELNSYEKFANIYAVDVGTWVPYCPVDTVSITPEYAEEKLNDLVKGKVDEAAKQKVEFEQRKIIKMNKMAEENDAQKAANKAADQVEKTEVNESDLLEILEEEEVKPTPQKAKKQQKKKNRRRNNKKNKRRN